MTDDQRKLFNKFFVEKWDHVKDGDFEIEKIAEEGAKATGYAESTVRSYFYTYLHETYGGRRKPILTEDDGIKFEYIERRGGEAKE